MMRCRRRDKTGRMPKRKTDDEFREQLAEKNPAVIPIGRYKTANESVQVKCANCGREFLARPSNLLGSKNKAPSGCPWCKNNVKLSQHRFEQLVEEASPSIEVIGKYTGNKNHVEARCKTCGLTWYPIAQTLMQGHGCPACGRRRANEKVRISHADFVKRVAASGSNFEILGIYAGMHSKVKAQCKNCGIISYPVAENILNGAGCKFCAKGQTSFLEQFILAIVRDIVRDDIPVLSRDRTIIGRELDVVVPERKIAIEPGNWFWHKEKFRDDEEKRRLCNRKGWRLITIYTSYPSDKPPFSIDCYVYSKSLSAQDKDELKEISNILARELELGRRVRDGEITRAIETATKASLQTTGEFKARLVETNPAVEVIGKYHGARTPVKVRCLNPGCGNTWMANPAALLQGRGCPKCRYKKSAKSLMLDHDEFVKRLARIHSKLAVTGEYQGRHKPVSVKCTACERECEWAPSAGNVLAGHGYKGCTNRQAFREQLCKEEREGF